MPELLTILPEGQPVTLPALGQAIADDFANITSPAALTAFGSVVLLDIALAGDNAVIVGSLAAGLPPEQRRRVIAIGIAAALVLRIVFAIAILWGLERFRDYGLVFGGGLLLLWVGYKMWRELRGSGGTQAASGEHDGIRPAKTFAAAAWSVAVADVSMSLDNVLAVAGAAREHPGILVVGLILSVILMGAAANIIARYIERYHWIAWIGLAIVFYVAGKMIYDGWFDIQHHVFRLFA